MADHLQRKPTGRLSKNITGHLSNCPKPPNPCAPDPGVLVTVTFAGGGTFKIFGESFSSGESKVICPETYTCDGTGSTQGELWAVFTAPFGQPALLMSGSATTGATVWSFAIRDTAGGDSNFTLVMNDANPTTFVPPSTFSNNISTKWTTAQGLGVHSAAFIGNNQFGQITTDGTGGFGTPVTITWARNDPSEWNACGI